MSAFPPKVKKKPMAEINVVPYIDVMLVLLVVFMVTAPMLMQGVSVDLPQSPSTPMDEKDDEPLIVSIKKDGTYYIEFGGKPEESKPLDFIHNVVSKVMQEKPQTPVYVWGDREVPYGDVITLMTMLQNAGAPSVGLVTEPL